MTLNYKIALGSEQQEHLNVDYTKQAVKYVLSALNFVDKDTKQHIIYMPSLKISGYGETKEKAEEMMQFSLQEYCSFLLSLSKEQVAVELAQYGWKSGIYGKEYSTVFVDKNGELNNLNAEYDNVERITLTSA